MARRRQSPPSISTAVGYSRVSTTEQGDSGLGLAEQRDAIERECDRRGWQLVDVLTDVASGSSTNGREALAEALERLDGGSGGILVVAKLDRLARSLPDFVAILARAERNGWAVVALDANVDTTTPSGALMVNVLAAFADYERRIIGARTKAALAAKKAQGARLGRPVTLASDVRARIRSMREAGQTLTAIAETLNDERVPTAQGGARWWPATVRAVLQSLDRDVA